MKIALGADHAGFRLKETLRPFLERLGHQIHDFGAVSEDSVDYPLFAREVAEAVARGDAERGILVCGSGIGMAIAANKVHGVRAANVVEPFSAELARRHNDANVLALGGRITGPGLAERIVEVFLSTAFEGGRHQRRVEQIDALR